MDHAGAAHRGDGGVGGGPLHIDLGRIFGFEAGRGRGLLTRVERYLLRRGGDGRRRDGDNGRVHGFRSVQTVVVAVKRDHVRHADVLDIRRRGLPLLFEIRHRNLELPGMGPVFVGGVFLADAFGVGHAAVAVLVVDELAIEETAVRVVVELHSGQPGIVRYLEVHHALVAVP